MLGARDLGRVKPGAQSLGHSDAAVDESQAPGAGHRDFVLFGAEPLGVTQTALAESVGITFQQIQKYERGFNRISFSRLVDIAHALDCRVIDLIGDLDDAAIPSPLFRQDTGHLRESGAPELLAAYAAASAPLRRRILKLVVEIAKDQKAKG
jgi:transcriptional regulator with XRE-family HTH domain